MQRVVILVPGIHTSRKEAQRWLGLLGDFIETQVPGARCLIYNHGWIAAIQIAFPFFGGWFIDRKVKRFQKWVAARMNEIDPSIVPDVVAHSVGTRLVDDSMTHDGGPHTFWDHVIFMGGIVSSRKDFEEEADHFWRLLNFFSRHDEVVRTWPYGHCGWKGFIVPHPRVKNWECHFEHTDYQLPSVVWDKIVAFLKD